MDTDEHGLKIKIHSKKHTAFMKNVSGRNRVLESNTRDCKQAGLIRSRNNGKGVSETEYLPGNQNNARRPMAVIRSLKRKKI